jgi:hypothetical protein
VNDIEIVNGLGLSEVSFSGLSEICKGIIEIARKEGFDCNFRFQYIDEAVYRI